MSYSLTIPATATEDIEDAIDAQVANLTLSDEQRERVEAQVRGAKSATLALIEEGGIGDASGYVSGYVSGHVQEAEGSSADHVVVSLTTCGAPVEAGTTASEDAAAEGGEPGAVEG